MDLQHGMTKESLAFVIESILGGCCEKLQDHMPDAITITERQSFVHPSFKMSDQENGLIRQAVGSVAIILAHSIDDGVGDTDADTGFYKACEKFIASNWRGYGMPCQDRYKVLMKQGGGWNYKDMYEDYPDFEGIARKIVEIFTADPLTVESER